MFAKILNHLCHDAHVVRRPTTAGLVHVVTAFHAQQSVAVAAVSRRRLGDTVEALQPRRLVVLPLGYAVHRRRAGSAEHCVAAVSTHHDRNRCGTKTARDDGRWCGGPDTRDMAQREDEEKSRLVVHVANLRKSPRQLHGRVRAQGTTASCSNTLIGRSVIENRPTHCSDGTGRRKAPRQCLHSSLLLLPRNCRRRAA